MGSSVPSHRLFHILKLPREIVCYKKGWGQEEEKALIRAIGNSYGLGTVNNGTL